MKSANDVRLYFQFFPKEFAFAIDENDSIPKAHVSLFYRITNSYSSIQIIDSLTSNFTLKGNPKAYFLGFMPLNLPSEGTYILEIFLSDLNSKRTISDVIEYKHTFTGGNNSIIFLSQFGNPLFYPYFAVTDTFRVRSEMPESKPMWVSYYQPDNRLPDSPDIQKDISLEPAPVDTSWTVENPDTMFFSFNKQGIYYFSTNSGLAGKTYPCFNVHYPYTKTPDDLLSPLAYLCSEKEMKKYRTFENPKTAVDTFWMKTSKDLDKSRELIRIFYNRVQLSNYYFTDFREGWLTDRGMIYIICGAPALITKADEGEYWVYGKGKKESIKFFFYRETHPLFGNTYILERSDLYSRMWYNAITTWRDGRVFSLNP
jgi:GWxTD domain-containing protein